MLDEFDNSNNLLSAREMVHGVNYELERSTSIKYKSLNVVTPKSEEELE